MTNKKTLVITISIALILVVGILIFSSGIQKVWQTSNETENNIDVTTTPAAINESSLDYPFESIANMQENTYSKDSLINSIYSADESLLPLQDAVNKVGEFLKLNYGFTEAQTTTAYADYVMRFGPNSPEIYYFITLDNYTINVILSGFTHEILLIHFINVSDFPEGTLIYDTYDESLDFVTPSEEKVSLLDAKIEETLRILGYNQTLVTSECYTVLSPTSFFIPNSNGAFARYQANAILSDDSVLNFYFIDTSTGLMLFDFHDETLLAKFYFAIENNRIIETLDAPKANLQSNIDYPYQNLDSVPTNPPVFVINSADAIVTNPNVNASLQDASNIIGEFITMQYPDISADDISAHIDYIENSSDSSQIHYYAHFKTNDIPIYVTGYINPMTYEVLRLELLYYNKLSEYETTLSPTQLEEHHSSPMPVDENITTLIDENIDKTLEFLGYTADINSIEYSHAISALPSDISYYLTYKVNIHLTDGSELETLYSGNSSKVNLLRLVDLTAQERFQF